jgi:hypothetical protein
MRGIDESLTEKAKWVGHLWNRPLSKKNAQRLDIVLQARTRLVSTET